MSVFLYKENHAIVIFSGVLFNILMEKLNDLDAHQDFSIIHYKNPA